MSETAGRPRYWAFLSYSWVDRRRARLLHRRLEKFVIPRHLRQLINQRGPSSTRLRPVFRDDEEMSASGHLDQRLKDAINDAVAMVLLASRDSATSHYVNLEVDHFVTTRNIDHLVIIAIGEDTLRLPELPSALEGRISNPVWVDQRGRRRLDRRSLVRIAATVIGVDFDTLWRRHVRRLRWLTALWCALAVLVCAAVGTAAWQQHIAQQLSPEQQRAQFVDWLEFRTLRGEPTLSRDDLWLNVVRVDDLDNDNLLDYFVINETPAFCGSGGCTLEVYLTKSPGDYTMALQLLGASTPRVRTAADGTKEIATTDFFVSREPLYSIYSVQSGQFQLQHYEFCDGVIFEMCEPLVITPVPSQRASEVIDGTVHRERPSLNARQVIIGSGDSAGSDSPWDSSVVIGAVRDSDWYLAQLWKGSCGFVPASALEE